MPRQQIQHQMGLLLLHIYRQWHGTLTALRQLAHRKAAVLWLQAGIKTKKGTHNMSHTP